MRGVKLVEWPSILQANAGLQDLDMLFQVRMYLPYHENAKQPPSTPIQGKLYLLYTNMLMLASCLASYTISLVPSQTATVTINNLITVAICDCAYKIKIK